MISNEYGTNFQSGGIRKISTAYFCPKCGNLYDITNKLPEETETSTEDKIKKDIYFICTICGNYEKIEPRTLLVSKKSKEMSKEYIGNNIKPEILIDVPTLPHTRNYICPNKTCKTNSQPETRDAVMTRVGDTFKMLYVCVPCGTVWS